MARLGPLIGQLLLRFPVDLASVRSIPIAGKWLHQVSHRLLPPEEIAWTRVREGPGRGLWLELHPRTGREYRNGTVEPAVQNILAESLRPGMVFYDLGANIGFFTLLGSRIVGEQGKVFSFEPDRITYARLRRNIERNQASNVSALSTAVWSTTGEVTFMADDPAVSPDRAWGRSVQGAPAGEGATIECTSMDDFLRGAPPPDVIKCDVEGAEGEVFRGAERLLSSHRPLVICEAHPIAAAQPWRELLQSKGYALSALDEYHVLAEP